MKTLIFALLPAFLVFTWGEQPSHVAERPSVIVSTDIGGSDPDDYQSLVHLLLYADRFDLKALISSPPGEGRKQHIEEVVAAYASDYPRLKAHRSGFPWPEHLLAISFQGATDPQPAEEPAAPSDGALQIVKLAEAATAPLYVLVWGSLTDVAQAVHFRPAIKQNIRVYSIGSWNTEQDPKARDYLFQHHPDLWWIENNTTFRGMYMGGDTTGGMGNLSFVETHVKGHGAMGNLFFEKKKDIKMGDTPSVLYFLHGDYTDPEGESWGGSFVKTGHGPHYWTDNPADSLIENNRPGARTVNRFRQAYLRDWAERMRWLE